MKFSYSIFAVPSTLFALSFLVNCGSDNTGTPTPSGGSPSSAGKGGASGGSVSAGGGGAGGASAGSTSSAGANTAGANTAGAAGGAVEASFATVKGIIGSSCFGAICHDLADNPLQLKPESMLYMTLTTHVTANCGKLVNTASPGDSALVKILQGSCGTPPNTTERMPYQKCFDGDTPADNEFCISTANIAAIQAWIAKGAPQQ